MLYPERAGWLATLSPPAQALLSQHLSGLCAASSDDAATLGGEAARHRCRLQALDTLRANGLSPEGHTAVWYLAGLSKYEHMQSCCDCA